MNDIRGEIINIDNGLTFQRVTALERMAIFRLGKLMPVQGPGEFLYNTVPRTNLIIRLNNLN